MNNEIVVYKLLGIYRDPNFKQLLGEVQKDALFCDTCYRPGQNPYSLVKYKLFQTINGSDITITDNNDSNLYSGLLNVIDGKVSESVSFQGKSLVSSAWYAPTPNFTHRRR